MKFKIEKNVRIISDLIAYCYRMGGGDYHIEMKLNKNVSVFYISVAVPKLTQEDLKSLEETLRAPRQHEMEQNYWAISGDSDGDLELSLVGMMIDDAKIDFTDGVLTIMARREEGR